MPNGPTTTAGCSSRDQDLAEPPRSTQQHLTHFTFRVVHHPAVVVEDHRAAAGVLERFPRQAEITNGRLPAPRSKAAWGHRHQASYEWPTIRLKVAAANTNPFGKTLAPSGWCLHRGYGHAVHPSSVQHAVLKKLQIPDSSCGTRLSVKLVPVQRGGRPLFPESARRSNRERVVCQAASTPPTEPAAI